MSARHRRHLMGGSEDTSKTEASDDEDDELPPPRRNQWSKTLALDDSDCSDSEASDDPVEEAPLEVLDALPKEPVGHSSKTKGKAGKKKKGKQMAATKSAAADEDAALDEALALMSTTASSDLRARTPTTSAHPLAINAMTLNIDTELKRKFGSQALDEGGAGRGSRHSGGKKQQARGSRLLLRSLFATVRDDWPPPPPFVAGGLRSTPGVASSAPALWGGAAQLIEFEYSEEYSRLEDGFRAIQSSGDVESMAYFLAVLCFSAVLV